MIRPLHSDKPGFYGVSYVDNGKWLFTRYYTFPPHGWAVLKQEQRLAHAIKAGWGKKFLPIVLVSK
jgi:hypothetical protein